MTIRAIVLFTAALLFAAVSVSIPVSAANLGNPASLNEKAPAVYKAKFDTSKGAFVIEVHRDWAPNGADRFYNLVKNGFYNDARFFRVIDGFMVQFGISGNPDLSAVWRDARIPDDRVKQSNTRGTVSFATAGPNTRTTQVFINFGDNAGLDGQGFSPFGKVVSGMDVVDSLFKGYGEGAPRGRGPDQGRIQQEGNAYLITKFPKLDYIKKATIEQ
jgi:peptidyl-prolyl cis-trans isomerase A (cyclophilin A)